MVCGDKSLGSEPQSLHHWEGYSLCMRDKLSVFALQMTVNKTQTVLYRAPTSLSSPYITWCMEYIHVLTTYYDVL